MRISDWSSDVCSSDLLWARVRIEDVATPEAFARDRDRVHAFYNQRRAALVLEAVVPNAAHRALARLEAEWPGDVLLVTQNIDDLHERAGSRNLIHMHGELLTARCLVCGGVRPGLGADAQLGRAACRDRVGRYGEI